MLSYQGITVPYKILITYAFSVSNNSVAMLNRFLLSFSDYEKEKRHYKNEGSCQLYSCFTPSSVTNETQTFCGTLSENIEITMCSVECGQLDNTFQSTSIQ